jgi:predicted AlkP superfamily pyrophosphatase or phosphodiesterase
MPTNQRKRTLLIIAIVILATAISLWWVVCHKRNVPFADLKPTLILISIDGFRADYFEKYEHPALVSLAQQGVRAKWMTPSYPSLTFPNHYAIATGLYPENHGIVANEFFDPEFKATFALNKREEVQNGRWWGGEPIWITAIKQGELSAPVFFPGSEAEIGGTRPTVWKAYDDKVTPADRVDGVLSLLDKPGDQRPTFMTLYFSNVDHEGHEHSPDSAEVGQAIKVVDAALERLVSGLRARNIFDRVNIVIVSDHGMTAVEPNNVVLLDDYLPVKDADHIAWGSQVTNIFPKAGTDQLFINAISNQKLEHAQCYRKQDMPERFHYRLSRRIGAIVCMADEGWRIFSRARYTQEQHKPDWPAHTIGAHGYDNQLPSMRAIFIARGPAFKHGGVVVEPFPNVDVYDVMIQVLGLAPAKNDGNANTARAVLR